MSSAPRPQLVLPPSAVTSMAHLPAFVEHGGELVGRHPATAVDARLYGFVLAADNDLLDRYCDRMFNGPAGGSTHWEAVGDEVLLNFVDIPTLGSGDLEDMQLGTFSEREVAIWFPVTDKVQDRFAWAVPYMFVDSDQAMAGGREVYGFPKQLGTINFDVDDAAPALLTVDTVTLRSYAPDASAETCRVAKVELPGVPSPLGPAWTEPAQALRDVIRAAGLSKRPTSGPVPGAAAAGRAAAPPRFPDVRSELQFFEHLVAEDLPMLLLKQFRDAHQQGAACYQAIVLADMEVSLFRGGGLLPNGYHVTVGQLDGEPIIRELGVAPSSEPRAAFWLDFDFVIRLGTLLWEWPGARR